MNVNSGFISSDLTNTICRSIQDPKAKTTRNNQTAMIRMADRATSLVAVIPPYKEDCINEKAEYQKMKECYEKILKAVSNDQHASIPSTIVIPTFSTKTGNICPMLAAKAAVDAAKGFFKKNSGSNISIKFVCSIIEGEQCYEHEKQSLQTFREEIAKLDKIHQELIKVEAEDASDSIGKPHHYVICPVRELNKINNSGRIYNAIRIQFEKINTSILDEIRNEEAIVRPLIEKYMKAVNSIQWQANPFIEDEIANAFNAERKLFSTLDKLKYIKSLAQSFADLSLFSYAFGDYVVKAKMYPNYLQLRCEWYNVLKTQKNLAQAKEQTLAFRRQEIAQLTKELDEALMINVPIPRAKVEAKITQAKDLVSGLYLVKSNHLESGEDKNDGMINELNQLIEKYTQMINKLQMSVLYPNDDDEKKEHF